MLSFTNSFENSNVKMNTKFYFRASIKCGTPAQVRLRPRSRRLRGLPGPTAAATATTTPATAEGSSPRGWGGGGPLRQGFVQK